MKTHVCLQPILILAALFSLAGRAPAVDLAADPGVLEFRQLENDIPSLYLINGLFLSSDQAQQLASQMAAARALNDARRREIEDFLQQNKDELGQFLEEVARNSATLKDDANHKAGKAKKTLRLQQIRRDWFALIGAKEKENQALTEKTLALLTPSQLDIVARFVPCFIPPQDFRNPERVGQADGDTSAGEKILERLRSAPAERAAEGREKALEALVPQVMKERHRNLTAEEIQKLREKVGRSLDRAVAQARGMSDADFALEKSRLARDLLKADQNAAEQGSADQKEMLEKCRRYLLNPGVMDAIALRGGAASVSACTDASPVALRAALMARGLTFRCAALMTELQLTRSQAERILPLVKSGVAEREQIDEDATRIMTQALEAYRALKTELAAQQPTQKTEANAQKYHSDVKRLYEDKLVKQLLGYENQIDQVLSADQVECLAEKIYPKPGSAGLGQKGKETVVAKTRARALALLNTVEKMNAGKFAKAKHDLCARFVEECVNGSLCDRAAVDIAAETARVEGVLERAKMKNGADFVQAKAETAAELCPRRNTPRTPVYGWKGGLGDPLEVLNPTTDQLFCRDMRKLLEVKLVEPGL